jgi:hypothetical protein
LSFGCYFPVQPIFNVVFLNFNLSDALILLSCILLCIAINKTLEKSLLLNISNQTNVGWKIKALIELNKSGPGIFLFLCFFSSPFVHVFARAPELFGVYSH